MITGMILAYNTDVEAGVIKGVDGKPYYFTKADWSSPEVKPSEDIAITFIPNRGCALKVKRIPDNR